MAIEQVPTPSGDITGQVLFYSKPEPLTAEAHGRLKLKISDAPFGFAAQAHIVPLQVTEFGLAGMSYPIIFAGDAKSPMAVLGLRSGDNLFIDGRGQYESFAYIPGFIRRYPFVLAGDEGRDQLIVCIDRNAPMVGEEGDAPLFEDGQLTPAAQTAVQFCSDFETERRRTEQFVARMKQLDLFEPKVATFTPRNPDGGSGQPLQIADYFAISEEKLNALGDADLRDLQVTGALRQIHAHLNSMANWEKLIGRAAQRGMAGAA
jgi:hypothetical protein